MLTSKQRAWLRKEAHAIDSLVQIGHDGINDGITRHVNDLLRTRELVKVSVQRTAAETTREYADALAEELDAEVVQVVGRKIVLYRHSNKLEEEGRSLVLPQS